MCPSFFGEPEADLDMVRFWHSFSSTRQGYKCEDCGNAWESECCRNAFIKSSVSKGVVQHQFKNCLANKNYTNCNCTLCNVIIEFSCEVLLVIYLVYFTQLRELIFLVVCCCTPTMQSIQWCTKQRKDV